MHKRRAESLDKALEYFQQAIIHDPQFALAYAGLSKVYFLASDVRYGNLPDDEAAEKSRVALRMAESLDDRLPEVLELLSSEAWDNEDIEKAEALIVRAIEVNPNYAPAYKLYGNMLVTLERWNESLVARRSAVALDPLSPVLRLNLAGIYSALYQMDEAESEILTAIELDPGWHSSYQRLAVLARSRGQLARSIGLHRKAYSMEGSDARWAGNAAMGAGYSYLALGDYAAAEQWFDRGGELGFGGWSYANFRLHLLLAQGRYEEADALLTESISSLTSQFGEDNKLVREARESLAVLNKI